MGQCFSKSSIFCTVCYIPVWFTKTLNAADANKHLQSFHVCLSQVDVYQIFLHKPTNNRKWLLDRTQQNQLKKSFFKKKSQELCHLNLYFNKFVVEKVETQKQLELKLDKKLSFKETLSQRLIYQS